MRGGREGKREGEREGVRCGGREGGRERALKTKPQDYSLPLDKELNSDLPK